MPGSHDRIVDIFKELPKGKVLDAPAGAGALSLRLQTMGFEVSCCDIDSGNFHHHDKFELSCADFNRDTLCYDDDTFDYVVCANGLHRLYYQENVIKEFSRVTKPGGKLILSWPNYNSMARRVKFLFTGGLGGSIDFAQHDQTISDPAAKIRFPLSASRMNYLLESQGIKIDQVEAIGHAAYDYAFAPLSLLVSVLTRPMHSVHTDNKWPLIFGGSTTVVVCQNK